MLIIIIIIINTDYYHSAILISRNIKNAQGLINLFQAWCFWAKMEIRLDKCATFGMVKKDKNMIQIMPNLSINSGQIPPVEMGDFFTYLGKKFDFDLKWKAGENQYSK